VCDISEGVLTLEKVRSLLGEMSWIGEGVGGKLRKVNFGSESCDVFEE